MSLDQKQLISLQIDEEGITVQIEGGYFALTAVFDEFSTDLEMLTQTKALLSKLTEKVDRLVSMEKLDKKNKSTDGQFYFTF